MKKTCLLFLIIYFFFCSISRIWAEDKKLSLPEIKMQFFNVAPHAFLDHDTGRITGAVYELINDHIAPEMAVKFIWNESPSNVPRQFNTLESKKGYASALLVYSSERAELVDFTKTPYFLSQSVLIVHQSNPLKTISRLEDILHLKIGYSQKTFKTPFMRDQRIQFDMINHSNFNAANIQKLLLSRVDAVYAPDKAGMLYVIHSLNADKELRVINLPEKPAPFHIVFSKDSKNMVEKYNQAFDRVDAQALYLRLLKRYQAL